MDWGSSPTLSHIAEGMVRIAIPRDGLHDLVSEQHDNTPALILDHHGRRRRFEGRWISAQPGAA